MSKKPVQTLERIHLEQHAYPLSVGVDEAGRGPLAGEVVAAAVILPAHHGLALQDSKTLTAAKRETLAVAIKSLAIDYAIVGASPAQIDQLNILQATLWAMQQAIAQLKAPFQQVYVDGNRCPQISQTCHALVKGDARLDIISAASILAKVHRDQQMAELAKRYPDYGFEQHKGYPTPAHLAAIAQWGVLAEHRRSFKPIKNSL